MPKTRLSITSKKTTRRLLIFFKKIVCLAIICALFLGIYYFFQSDFFKIKNIKCQNEFFCPKTTNEFDIIGKNIFTLNGDKLAESVINKNIEYKTVKISKKLPDQIMLDILPRKAIAYISKDNQVWYLVDENCFVYKKVFEINKDQGTIFLRQNDKIILGSYLNNPAIQKILDFAKYFNKNSLYFKAINILADDWIEVILLEPIKVNLSLSKSISAQLDSLQFILRTSRIEGKLPVLIDLRFEKPVIKY